MPQPTQATRHIAIETPLGEDALLLQSFSGHEEISRLFEYDLELLSEDYEINFDDIIGQNVTVRMELPEGGRRYLNGHISRFVQGVSKSPQFAQYRATMVPWLWFLTRTSDCRIFQEKTVPDIVKEVFSDLGFSDIEDRLSGGYRTWTYCVQYRETDFNFVSRLMEQEGIYYYFSHEQGKHTIVLCDSLSKHDPFGDYGQIDFIPDTQSSAILERISEWTLEKQVQSGKFAHIDYNFEKPSTSLMSNEEDPKSHDRADYEIYDYPGEYSEKPDGDRYAKVRMEELAHSHEICSGQSDSRGICAGHLFTLTKHTRKDQNREYLIVSTDYQAAAVDYETSGGTGALCACSFQVLPSSVQFRPERKTPKPVIQGTQTAVVTGPAGEEIYTDEHGRIKVQFHWDREGKYDENSSCWIRVSHGWAGAGWGAMYIPRIGHEVIVDFIEGDPDRPIITGRVYHGTNKPPYDLPAEKTKSTLKSDSTIGGGGFNELRFEDKKGSEEVFIHAEKDWNIQVKNCESETVGANISTNAGASISRGAGKDISRTADDNIIDKAGKNITAESGKNMNLKAGGSYQLWTNLGIHLKAMNFVAALIESGAKKAAEAIKKGATQTAAAGAQASATGGAATGAAGSQLASGGETTGMQALAALSPGIEAGAAELTRLSNQADRADQLNEPVNRAIEASDQLGRAIESGASPEAIAESAMALADASTKAFGDAQKLVEEMLPQIPSIVMWAMKDINARALWSMNFSTKVKDMSFNAENKDINLKAKQNVNLEAETKDLNVKAGKKNVLITGKKEVNVKAEEDKMVIEAGKEKVFVKSPKQIFLKCGSASISMAKSGNIVIKGAKINIKGSGPVQVKGKPIKMN